MTLVDELTSYYNARFPGPPDKQPSPEKIIDKVISNPPVYSQQDIKTFIHSELEERISIEMDYSLLAFNNSSFDLVIFDEDIPVRLVFVKKTGNGVWSNRKTKGKKRHRQRLILSERNKQIEDCKQFNIKVDFVCGISRARKYVKKILRDGIYQDHVYLAKQ